MRKIKTDDKNKELEIYMLHDLIDLVSFNQTCEINSLNNTPETQ